ncbi:hypothetical protein D3C78_1060340 [compost metagenome]
MTTCVTAVVSGNTRPNDTPAPGVLRVSMRPPRALTSARTTSMPMPRPDTPVTCVAVVKPGRKISWPASCGVMQASAAINPRATAVARMRSRSRPAPSSSKRTSTSLPSCCSVTPIVPVASLPAARRRAGVSMPWATQLRSRCSKAGAMRSSTPRSISMVPPTMFSRTCLPISLDVWRTTAYRRSEMASNSTMRVRSRSRCRSRAWRP